MPIGWSAVDGGAPDIDVVTFRSIETGEGEAGPA